MPIRRRKLPFEERGTISTIETPRETPSFTREQITVDNKPLPKEDDTKPKLNVKLTEPVFKGAKVIRDEDTGMIKGLETETGEIIRGSPEEINQEIALRNKKGIPINEASDIAQLQTTQDTAAAKAELQGEQSGRAQELFQQLQGKGLSQEELANLSPSDINILKAIVPAGFGIGVGAGVAGLTTLLGGTAATGGIAGAVAIGAALLQVRSNIRQQISGQITVQGQSRKKLESSLRNINSNINSGDDPVDNVRVFYENVHEIRVREALAKKEQQRFLTTLTGQDATEELAGFAVFFDITLPQLERDLQLAILNPDPNKIKITPEEPENI